MPHILRVRQKFLNSGRPNLHVFLFREYTLSMHAAFLPFWLLLPPCTHLADPPLVCAAHTFPYLTPSVLKSQTSWVLLNFINVQLSSQVSALQNAASAKILDWWVWVIRGFPKYPVLGTLIFSKEFQYSRLLKSPCSFWLTHYFLMVTQIWALRHSAVIK